MDFIKEYHLASDNKDLLILTNDFKAKEYQLEIKTKIPIEDRKKYEWIPKIFNRLNFLILELDYASQEGRDIKHNQNI